MDELDLNSVESKATYTEIKDYVLKAHGLKVSNIIYAKRRGEWTACATIR